MRPQLRAPSLQSIITFVVVAASSLFVFGQLKPHLLFMDTLTAGGDMGAHVWLPWFLKNHLLAHGRISGWTPDWYDGFPALTFYFPLPAMLVALLSFVIPYGVAFKLVTVSGIVSLPVSAWAFGKLSKLPFPVPACLSAAMVPFLFDQGYTILGGNIASTLAGEFAFSIGLSLALVFLGIVAGGLDTNKRRGWAALLFGLIILSHILPTIFALVGGIVLVAMRAWSGGTMPWVKDPSQFKAPSQRRVTIFRCVVVGGATAAVVSFVFALIAMTKHQQAGYFFAAIAFLLLTALFIAFFKPMSFREFTAGGPRFNGPRFSSIKWAVAVGVVGGMVSGFWALPFAFQSQYMNDMGWEKIGTGTEAGMKLYDQNIVHYSDGLFPNGLAVFLFLGLIGAGLALYMRRRPAMFWVWIGLISIIGFVFMPQGRLWNARLLPFYYLSLYMLAGYLVSEVGWLVADKVRRMRGAYEFAEGFQVAAPLLAFTLALAWVMPKLPAPDWFPQSVNDSFDDLGLHIWHDPVKSGASFIPSWAEWNYAGYDGKKDDGTYYKPSYPEYQSVMQMMGDVGKQHGCGRVMWEYEPTLDRFGTPMALMLSPMHTNDCMGSEEGLFFESSATVPYHFLNQALLSKTPSSAMRSLPYGSLDVASGISKLQMLGAKYYLAVSPDAQQQAALDPRLTMVASVPAAADTTGQSRTWNMYEIADTSLVAPLQNLPNVMSSPQSILTRRDGKAPNKEPLSKREAWLENSLNWYQDPTRSTVPLADGGPASWPRVRNESDPAITVPVTDPARVTRISMSDDSISFHVDNPGSPVIVRASYFPDWKVDGAKGVYRLSPNLMVVTPTKKDVTMHYGHSSVDIAGALMSVVGLFGVAYLLRRDRRMGDVVEMDGRPAFRPSDSAQTPPGAPDWVTESPHLVKVESSADGTNAEVLEIHNPPTEPKTS